MADPRTDFFAAGADNAPASNQDARTAFFASAGEPATPAPRKAPTASEHMRDVLNIARQHPFTAPIGLAENALSGVTGGVGSLADAVTMSDPGTHAWAYQPRTQAGQQIAQASADEGAAVGRGYSHVFGEGPLAETVKDYAPEALGAVGTVTGLAEIPKGVTALGRGVKALRTPGEIVPETATAQEVLNRQAAASPQNQGAAAAAPRITEVSPELQKAVLDAARKNGGAVNSEVLGRHIEADTLPVRVQLTPGQASQDPILISRELNNRARTPGMPELLNEQNKRLGQNIQAIRDQVGPDVFSTNPVEHGDSLISAYEAKDAPIRAQISANYKALEDANGGQFPVDGKTFVANADKALAAKMKGRYVPSEIKGDMEDFRSGQQMTFENFENLRTNLAAEARKAERSGDGNALAAINIVRQNLEDLPMTGAGKDLKALADKARASAKARFDALRADPAYDAAVNGKVSPDQFVQKFLTGPSATRDGVALMRENLKDNPVALQTMGVAALDHLRGAAGLDWQGNGTFSQSGYNKAFNALGPRMRSMVPAETAEQLEQLGNVARYTQFQPKGSFVNNSNTAVTLLGEHAADVAERAVNANTLGIGGTIARKALQGREAKRLARETMSPYGGLDRLPEKP